ncbi:MAG TPA: alpha/beta hydrolase [Alloacidobacterium sp.]|nr:alpha/beta hydrolase [Alloacidobacterium sp.]
MPSIQTRSLEIFYEEGGPSNGSPILLLHGWPDTARGWAPIAQQLQAQGHRTIAPYLRGILPTKFLSENTPRFAGGVALAQDAIELADALNLQRFAVAGHDWGARAAYIMAALFPERLTAITAMALAYQPRGIFKVPDFHQSKRFWYQWFQCIDGGVDAISKDPIGFARIQWETWSPPGWYSEEEFQATAQAFSHPDWVATTLNGYRLRWLPNEPGDSYFDPLQCRLSETEYISVPTLMIQGGSDFCDSPEESEGQASYFTGGYHRILINGAGHFVHREAPQEAAEAIADHIARR